MYIDVLICHHSHRIYVHIPLDLYVCKCAYLSPFRWDICVYSFRASISKRYYYGPHTQQLTETKVTEHIL
ncbi:hypothetical protein CI610_02807 [invertebrate metagenome]|uniref:Uncharacterized protein n=1 Tax=invertebrate metagenome TaxID=1711999 RepID=A0A2H9T4W6_9ZZZZ